MFLKPFWLWTPYRLPKTIEKCQYNVLQISGFFRSVTTEGCSRWEVGGERGVGAGAPAVGPNVVDVEVVDLVAAG
jgi:hypothetical protein